MSTPVRIQRRRTKDWRMPPNTVSVTRPGKYGNPYRGPGAVLRFEVELKAGKLPFSVAEVRRDLHGKNLACWCPLDQECHADVLLRVAR